jgi:hypothetical protein
MVAPNAVSREQAYLTSVANQPKDIDPDRIYEVSQVHKQEHISHSTYCHDSVTT